MVAQQETVLSDEQAKWLQEAGTSVKRNAFYMKRALDDDNLREALRYSAAMLGELRTSLLTPQRYFELYMQAFNELQHLEGFFRDETKKGRSYADLYELVQHAGNVLPRLYLLCMVGACFIRGGEGAARDILKDLVEMCKGVQHPTRGLFLRSYLCQVSKGLLPDTGSEFESEEGGRIQDAVDFLLLNFTEMNKLWVRMQHQGAQRDRDRREKERQQLADLVGKNLTYLSQLEGLNFELYQGQVHPRVLEQVVGCRDDLAQQYLMQCVVQVFPDDFHLGTLSPLLAALPQLQPGVKIHVILSSLLDRLARYASVQSTVVEAFDEAGVFQKLLEAAKSVVTQQSGMQSADVTAMYIALVQFTSAVYPDRLDYINQALTACHTALAERSAQEGEGVGAEKQLVQLLSIPLDSYDVVTVLALDKYPSVMALLSPPTRKEMAVKIVDAILKTGTLVDTVQRVGMLFDFIAPLATDVEGVEAPEDDEDFEEEQNLMARLMHQLKAPTLDGQFEVLKAARDRITQGGPNRLKHTIPAIAFAALAVVRGLSAEGQQGQSKTEPVLQFIHSLTAQLAEAGGAAEMALQLFLAAAQAASDEAHLDVIAYEFFEQAFIIYEEAIPDSSSERTALASIVGALQRIRVFSPDSRASLVHKATGYSAKLLRKADQCRAVLACSHLLWQEEEAQADPPSANGDTPAPAPEPSATDDASPDDSSPAGRTSEAVQLQAPVRDAEGVMSCLKRALKIAHAAQQQTAVARRANDTEPVSLFVEILNHYIFYFEAGLPTITASVLQNLLDLVQNDMAGDSCQKDSALVAFYKNTLGHIELQRARGGPAAERYKQIKVPA
ncbi:hypothetical protein WJX73_008689 [Symbiochloris irregularis]|uniref:Vacuolar protein sorting-associated protein 35 n=1 Tax=Symbiochloris irregularis TaxID=706552 RepID=A0AAW1P7N4_9CHLO